MMKEREKAVWNEVSTDFDPDEETANFGTRHALESGNNLYEVILIKKSRNARILKPSLRLS